LLQTQRPLRLHRAYW